MNPDQTATAVKPEMPKATSKELHRRKEWIFIEWQCPYCINTNVTDYHKNISGNPVKPCLKCHKYAEIII